MTDVTTQSGATNEVIDAEILAANAEPSEQETAQEAAPEKGQRQETERERVMREIAERRRAELTGAEDAFTEQAGDQPGIEDRQAAQPEMVRIKVDGEERMVPLSDIIEQGTRTLQKESTADKRLKEVAEMRQATELRAQQVESLARQIQAQQEQNQGQQLSKQDAIDVKQQARNFMEKFMAGDEEAAVDSLAVMLGRSNATPDVTAMIEKATLAAQQEVRNAENVRLQKEANQSHAKAKEAFSDSFKDIVSDPMLYRLADQETLQVLADHPEWDASQDIEKILMEAGKRVREWRGSTVTTSKQEIKRGLSKPISGTSGRMPGAPEAKPKTTSQVIVEQRRARGLPVY